ncbi:MAG: hypothetical protein ACRCZS_25330 [Chroococcidiopsis sp.]
MPDMNLPEEKDVTRGSTIPDCEVSLPVENLHITVSRIRVDGQYETRIWFNRRVRRFYAMGLLTEALAMLTASDSESEWCSDTPGCMDEDNPQSESASDFDDDGGASASVLR